MTGPARPAAPLEALMLLLLASAAGAQDLPLEPSARPSGFATAVLVGASAVLAHDVAGEVALFAAWSAATPALRLQLRGSYSPGTVGGPEPDAYSALVRDPTVHGRSIGVSGSYPVRAGTDIFLVPYIEAGVNFADWTGAPEAGRTEAGAVLFGTGGLRGISPNLGSRAGQDLRVVVDAGVVGRWIRSGIGKAHDLRQALLGTRDRDIGGFEASLSVQSATVKPRLRWTWFPPGGETDHSGFTEGRLSLDVLIRTALF